MDMKTIEFDKDKQLQGFWKEGRKSFGQDAISESIKRACRDIMPRTLKVKAGQDWGLADRLTEAKDSLTTRFIEYFKAPTHSSQKEFDKWHNGICEYILSVLKEKYETVCYGKAQKILNMTFKNLYCTQCGENENYFKFCHMPLDSYTLEWIFRNVYPTLKPAPTKSKTPSWSNFNFGEDQLDDSGKYTYPYIADLVNKYFDKYRETYESNLTTLQAEFVIWKEIQLEMATEGFYSQLLANYPDSDKNQEIKVFRDKSLHDKLDYVKTFLNSTTI